MPICFFPAGSRLRSYRAGGAPDQGDRDTPQLPLRAWHNEGEARTFHIRARSAGRGAFGDDNSAGIVDNPRFAEIQGREMSEMLYEAPQTLQAAVALLSGANGRARVLLFQQKEALMGTQSVALAGLQLLLAAHAEGLGGTWICWPLFTPDETRRALGLAQEWEPQGMLFLGYPDETPEKPERISLQEVTRFI